MHKLKLLIILHSRTWYKNTRLLTTIIYYSYAMTKVMNIYPYMCPYSNGPQCIFLTSLWISDCLLREVDDEKLQVNRERKVFLKYSFLLKSLSYCITLEFLLLKAKGSNVEDCWMESIREHHLSFYVIL